MKRAARAVMPTEHGRFTVIAYEDADGATHLALTTERRRGGVPLVRVHSACLTGEAFGSMRCDCGAQLREALARIAESGNGALIYLSQEGRGIGLANKVRSYALQDDGLDTVEANHQLGFPSEPRSFDVAVDILADLGIERLRLLTNNPVKVSSLSRRGIEIVERMSIEFEPNDYNRDYLRTKRDKLGHLLSLV